eukprot:CAMPEP_0170179484 /NCGR_PEP_ID=MMETSP0040_2-20121228/17978_1 /TAXON_ID=641309 /ORGANISM="Lotharella oceanica, Strain CCMP622" /LENGTH=170 /DNA_ID=CAMNT_0010423609 /DNA_START=125 /DNA_END=637 /DNA_ORIENTATION=+
MGIGKQNFVPQTYDQQLYNKGVQTRQRIAGTFNQRREDFDSLEAYNNYLELVADIDWGLSYGNEKEKKEAAAKMNKFARENMQKINARKLAIEEGTGASSMDATDLGGLGTEAIGGGTIRTNIPTWTKRANAIRQHVDPRIEKISGGFRFEDDNTRNREEADSGLLFGLE